MPETASTVATQRESTRRGPLHLGRGQDVMYAGAVLVGALLVVIAANDQPYNQNELQQMAPYASGDLHTITSGTRQPPLDALLAALVQHAVGTGQLRQRIEPVTFAIGSLVLMCLLLRRLGFGWGGVFAAWVLATQPEMIRYSAYSRPYALPVFLMLLCVLASHQWLTRRQAWWLVLVAIAAGLLPLSRVPEPTIFLLGSAMVVGVLGWRRTVPRRTAWPLVAVLAGALVFVGYPMYRSLSQRTGKLFDPSPADVVARFGDSAHTLVHVSLPLLGELFPWWPVTLVVLVLVVAHPRARHRLTAVWWVWPLLSAPLLFFLAFHFANSFSLAARPYRARYAYFFVPGLVLIVACAASTVRDPRRHRTAANLGLAALLAALLVGQLPATVGVVAATSPAGFGQPADFGAAATVLTTRLPADAIVLYDAPSPAGSWRQGFSGRPRYMGAVPFVASATVVARHPGMLPRTGPVYLLVLDTQCSMTVDCEMPALPWDKHVASWRMVERFDRFRLYAPDRGQSGRLGAAEAMLAFGHALGPNLGMVDTFAAAAIFHAEGMPRRGHAVIQAFYAMVGPSRARSYLRIAAAQHLGPYS
ncbi:MAG: ArnT family glycosyltransferase [Nocardioidaceae bacterium]